MKAYEFLAHDISGLTLSGVTDGGMCEWIGTSVQWSNAEMQMAYFAENGSFYHVDDYDESDAFRDEEQSTYERDDKVGAI